MITYAVGDIHGCYDGLRLVLDRIGEHAQGTPRRVVLLGDYVNIGPDSKKVLDHLIEHPVLLALRGNHDVMLVAAADGNPGSAWNLEYHGGAETLRSFGVARASEIPSSYIEFIRRGLLRYVEDEHRIFVHASIQPDVAETAQQDDVTMLWARTPFAPQQHQFAKYIVHGHWPQADGLPEILPHRCNLDSFGCTTGVFTCGVFDETQPDPIDIIQIR
ncbi:metallophosphoesterase family protein [Methylobacterium sp. JK268]